jgi:hypothetical protein
MSEATELHLYVDQGTPEEKIFTVEVSQKRLTKMKELMKQNNLTLVQAFIQTKELASQ